MRKFGVGFDVTEDYVEKVDRFVSLNLEKISGLENGVFPVPANFVIDKNGRIKFLHFDVDYGKRATVDDLLKGPGEREPTK
jgi:peroxiredoxin